MNTIYKGVDVYMTSNSCMIQIGKFRGCEDDPFTIFSLNGLRWDLSLCESITRLSREESVSEIHIFNGMCYAIGRMPLARRSPHDKRQYYISLNDKQMELINEAFHDTHFIEMAINNAEQHELHGFKGDLRKCKVIDIIDKNTLDEVWEDDAYIKLSPIADLMGMDEDLVSEILAFGPFHKGWFIDGFRCMDIRRKIFRLIDEVPHKINSNPMCIGLIQIAYKLDWLSSKRQEITEVANIIDKDSFNLPLKQPFIASISRNVTEFFDGRKTHIFNPNKG
jgi:hypothetical protein